MERGISMFCYGIVLILNWELLRVNKKYMIELCLCTLRAAPGLPLIRAFHTLSFVLK